MQSKHRLFIFFLILALLFTGRGPGSWNDQSRMATIQALVEHHSWRIENTDFARTGDKIHIRGHYYSDKPPATALIGAMVYFPLHACGINLNTGKTAAYYLITLLTVRLFWLAGLWAFHACLAWCNLDDGKRSCLTLALGMGTLYFPWSSTFNNHGPAASCLIIGYYFVLRTRFETHVRRNAFLAGLFMALAAIMDIPTAIFYASFLGYIIAGREKKEAVPAFLAPLLFTALPTLLFHWRLSGSMLPFQLHANLFAYPDSPWTASREKLSGMQMNPVSFLVPYGWRTFLGPRGFFVYNPLIPAAVFHVGRQIKRRQTFFREAVTISAASCMLIAYYLLFTSNYGGWSYSIRWFVPLIPLVFFFLYPYFQPWHTTRRLVFLSLLTVSSAIAFTGIINPWSNARLHPVPFMANITELYHPIQLWMYNHGVLD